ncbi:Ku protein [Streptomyces sp. NPDC047123]|uniref:non-homologous end joining protein Ku n=1 Tax=Streptomyces sp. NPDC047123 TaxID=3155622 RepID=UPI0033D64567
MRSIWNGAISFGLVSIPIKVVNATENHSVSFRQVHTEDGGRIRYRKVCELEDREVPTAEIGKGYEDADGSIVPVTDEDLAALPVPTAKTIEIVAFVPVDRVDPLQMDTAYYLEANGVPAAKPYTLLREALKRSEKVAVARFALRGRERLGMLRVVDDVIALHGLLWPDEIRAPEGVAPEGKVTVREAELDLADALMDTLGEVDISTLHDDYRAAVEELVAAKADGTAPAEPAPADEDGGKVIDLMAALENSVRAARTAGGGGSKGGRAPAGGKGGKSGKNGKGGKGADGDKDEVAVVTPLARPSSRAPRTSRTTPKEVGGKKSTSSATKKKSEPARKRATKATAPAKTATKATAKTATKATAKTATKATAKTASKATGSRTTAKKAATGKKTAAAKKTTAKRRSSA